MKESGIRPGVPDAISLPVHAGATQGLGRLDVQGRAPASPTSSVQSAFSQPGFAVVDVETTGFVPSRDRVIEVAVVQTDPRGRVVDEWSTLLDPQRAAGASHVHGLTTADLRHAPRFGEIVGELNTRLAGRALAAHNAAFDLNFLRLEYARAGWDMPEPPHLCTLEESWTYLPHLPRRRLTDCCDALGIPLDDAHSALADARATAALLAYYLAPAAERSPLREHLELPGQAVRTVWPAVPRTRVKPVHRDTVASLPAVDPGILTAFLRDLPLQSTVDAGAPASSTAYLELLAEVLEDGVLTHSEAAALSEVARLYSLTRDQVIAAHRGFLLALAHKAVADGTVTRAERAELFETATILGLEDTVVKTVLDQAHGDRLDQASQRLRPLPKDWPYGEPLQVGQRVVFTGCDALERARLEAAAKAAGLRVTGSVSRFTALLVTDGANMTTNKAIAAHRIGTRIVTPHVFTRLLDHVQPSS